MGKVLDKDRTHVYIDWKEAMEAGNLKAFKSLIKRAAAGEPIAYILGYHEFFSLPFRVDENVLIPRTETEELVEWILNDHRGESGLHILDVGTGSGVMAITLCKLLQGASVTATDVDRKALEVARKNADLNQVSGRIDFKEADFLEGLDAILKETDILVSNPPYIAGEDIERVEESVLAYEPHKALFTSDKARDSDGLKYYRRLAKKAPMLRGKTVYLEFGYHQKEALTQLFKDKGEMVFRRDSNGNWRMLKIEM